MVRLGTMVFQFHLGQKVFQPGSSGSTCLRFQGAHLSVVFGILSSMFRGLGFRVPGAQNPKHTNPRSNPKRQAHCDVPWV